MHRGCARLARNQRALPALVHTSTAPMTPDPFLRGLHREVVDVDEPSCSPSCRPSRASPRRAAPSRRSPASRSPPPATPASSSAPPTWRSACASRSRPTVERAGHGRAARRGCCSTSRARCRSGERLARAAARPSRTSRSSPAPRASTSARCAPRTSRRCPSRAATRSSRCRRRRSSRRSHACRASASRDETRPILTGILVSASARRAADGRDRLLPPERQGDRARGAARRRLRGQRPGPRAARSSARLVARTTPRRSGSACAPTRSSSRSAASRCRSRLIDGQFPNYRQLLPEAYEHELRSSREELLDGRAAHQPDGAEERAAAAGASPRAS